MTRRTFRIRKYMLCYQKICNFWENYVFNEIKFEKSFFFLAILKFLMAPSDAQQNFMQCNIFFIFLSLLGQKVISFFVKNLPKLNIPSSFYKLRSNKVFGKNELLKVFPVPGNLGALWCTTWQLCSENNLNDLGDIKYTSFR